MKTTSTNGWRQLQPGEPLQPGDSFLHPAINEWLDYECRPDIFRGAGTPGTWYHVPARDVAHTWPWRRAACITHLRTLNLYTPTPCAT